MTNLFEASRSQLLNKSKHSVKGKQRFDRRTKSKVATSVRQYNEIDMNKLFKEDVLEFSINITGETDSYQVKLRFEDILDKIRDQLERNNNELNFRCIVRGLLSAFDSEDVYVSCSCADWFYRFSYQSTKNDTNSGEPQLIPANITNPNDTLGSACKHVLLVLNNTSWMMKVASVVFNYINYMKERYSKLYADIIYPAIYGKEYDGIVQFNIDDKTTELLDTDKDTIDISNKQAAERGKFKQGNEQGYRFVKGKDKNQITIDDIDTENSEEEITDKQDI